MPARAKPIHTTEYRRMLAGLREARKQAGLSQATAAACFERPQSFVSKCESGERRIDPTELRKFAALYRKPVAYFLDELVEGPKARGEETLAPDSRHAAAATAASPEEP